MGNDIRNVLDAIAGSWIPKAAISTFVISLLFTLAIAVTQNIYTWSEVAPPRAISAIDVGRLGMVVGTSGTAAAFLVTLYVADRNYRRGREHIPGLTMDLQVARVPASQSYDAVIVTLNAKNTGTGLCRVDRVYWSLKALSPYDDDSIEEMKQDFDRTPDSARVVEFPWHILQEEQIAQEVVIEPNETHQVTYDFIIPAEITSVVASAWVANASEPKYAEGWYRRAVHVNVEA